MSELKAELQRLYADSSKHSVYQNVPDFVSAELGYTETIDEGWRGDRQRLTFLAESRTPAKGETWLDFGANTGFFALSLAHDFPQTAFLAVEANPDHARFIERVAHFFEMRNIEVIQRAVGLRELPTLPHSDFMLHLNVLHHAGHDFDAKLVPEKSGFAEYADVSLILARSHGCNALPDGQQLGRRPQPAAGGRARGRGETRDVRRMAARLGWNPLGIAYAHRRETGASNTNAWTSTPPDNPAKPPARGRS